MFVHVFYVFVWIEKVNKMTIVLLIFGQGRMAVEDVKQNSIR